jgi:hypothetical protein
MLRHYNPFREITLKDLRQAEIQGTEIALHNAKLRLERELATVAMLETSLNRLKAEHAHQ